MIRRAIRRRARCSTSGAFTEESTVLSVTVAGKSLVIVRVKVVVKICDHAVF